MDAGKDHLGREPYCLLCDGNGQQVQEHARQVTLH